MEKVRAALQRMVKTALGDSIPAEIIALIAKEVMINYNLRERSGLRASVPISGQIAASTVVDDSVASGRFLHLVERMARLDRDGYMGRSYRIPILRELLKVIQGEGYLWDESTSHFMENPNIRRTANWGRLLVREEYQFSLLRLDTVKNSHLVKRYGEEIVRNIYAEIRLRFKEAVEQRQGRVWHWEGDGGMAAFHYGQGSTCATLAGMAILNELFLFNRTDNVLGEPISVRLVAHAGPLFYSDSSPEIAKQETAKEIVELESRRGIKDALCLSHSVARTLDRLILDRFCEVKSDGVALWVYRIGREKE